MFTEVVALRNGVSLDLRVCPATIYLRRRWYIAGSALVCTWVGHEEQFEHIKAQKLRLVTMLRLSIIACRLLGLSLRCQSVCPRSM